MALTQRGIPLSKISPAFLHANSTSHTWVFSAFAEIIDNAYDPDVSASELLIDKVDIRNVACLIFLDNGAGMDRDKLHKMLSFGFCEKDIFESNSSHQPIGHYGNGFKSGSMRIGTDALVFTRSEHSASIGFLSQTYLNAIKAESVFVPILDYRLPKLERFKSQESRNNLNAILTYSVFKFEEELKAELRALEGSKTGTKIIISNLKRLENGNLELDFSSDPTDVRCPEAHEADMTSVYHRPVEQYTSEYKLSLREYCSILFLKPRMKITIRGNRVKSKLISKSLSRSEQDTYNPSWLANPVKIIFGFTCERERSEDYGLMLYHRNRLIKAFERVGYQKQPNDRGVGVVGVAQVDFLQPIHNKQDFKWDEKFNSVMKAFATKLNEYWNEKMNSDNPASSQLNMSLGNMPDWTWAQCDHCLKWRRLPDSINPESLPDKWYCRYNADGTHNRCDIPEEPEDEDMAVKPRFEKTFKKRQEEQKRQQRWRQMEEETKKKTEMEKQLRQKEEELRLLQHMKQPLVDPRALELEQALAEAQRCIEEQARLMEQMTSGAFPASPSTRINQQNGKFPQPPHSSQDPQSHHMKRKATVESLPTKENKKLCIKTETGEVLSITRNFGDDDEATDQDIVLDTTSRKTPKPKQAPKGAPLRVAMPFQPPKANHNAEKSKDIQETKGKRDSSTAANPSKSPAPEKSLPKNNKSRSNFINNDNGNFIDLTDDDMSFSEPVIKPDPDACESNSSENPTGDADVKPNKERLDTQIRGSAEVGMNSEEQVAPQSSQSQLQSGSSNELSQNISETIESNLETALTAIRERADKEKLGAVASNGDQAASSPVSTVAVAESVSCTDSALVAPCSDDQRSCDKADSGKTSSNKVPSKPSGAKEKGPEHSCGDTASTLPGGPLDSDLNLKSDPSSRYSNSKENVEAAANQGNHHSGAQAVDGNRERHSVGGETVNGNTEGNTCMIVNDAGCEKNANNVNEKNCLQEKEFSDPSNASEQNEKLASNNVKSICSQNRPVSNGDIDMDDSVCGDSFDLEDVSVDQRQDKSVWKEFDKSPTKSTDRNSSKKSLTQRVLSQTEKSGSEIVKTLNGFVNSGGSPVFSNSETFSNTSERDSNAVQNIKINEERTSDRYERGSNNGVNDQQVPSPSENSPSQSSSLHTVPCNKLNAGDHKDLLAAQTSAQPDAAGDRTTKDIKSAALKNQTTSVAQRAPSFERTTCSASVQTEMGAMDTNSEHTRSLQEALDRMQRNVYRLLQLLAPDKDLGDLSNIDQLVEGMIRDEELNSQSQSSFSQD